jgi:ribose transport system ATP-binding protein
VSFSVQPREVLGIAGLAGSGRTTLLRLLFGARRPEAGRIAVDGVTLQAKRPRDAMRAGIAYLPEDRAADGGFFDLGVRENLSAADVSRYWTRLHMNRRRETADAARDVSTFSIRAPSTTAPLSLLSGGNQQKVLLARWLRRNARVLLLDEPTHGVDVAARSDIYEAVRASIADGACAIVVSSDFEELVRVSDRVLVLAKGRVVAEASQPHLDRQWVEERAFHLEEAA